ncbi:MAG TPA: putative glycolipid-binding domain-containing protein [Devosia sp.]|jgi:hypothetical protein|nr:putative glycolipid-binding domain-containing protein [Devosia sp.]
MPLHQSIRWRSREHGGLEQLRINEWNDHIKVRSAIVSQSGDTPHGVFYEASLTLDWTFEAIMLQRTDGLMTVLRRSGSDGWADMHAEELPELKGCIDIDFEMTPFTNTLPIRRAPLAIGETRRFRMAYIPADTLEPFADEQTYTRLSERVYRFENDDGSFTADITVDENGLVVDYPELFERISLPQ